MKQFILKENVVSDDVLSISDKNKVFKGGYKAIVEYNTFLNSWQDKKHIKYFRSENSLIKFLKKRKYDLFEATPFYSCQTFAQYDKILGFAYTSSSSFAMYGICNTNLFLDAEHKYKIEFFALGAGGFVYAICWDKNENEIIFPIN